MSPEFTLDVSSCPEASRPGMPAALADRVESFLKTKFDADHGYSFKRRTSKPFQDRPQLLGYHAVVMKGFFWGSAVQITPEDFQVRQIKIKLVPDSQLKELALSIPLVLGLLAGVAAAIVTFKKSESDTGRNVILAFFLASFVVGGALFGVFHLLSKMLLKSFTDPAKNESEREALWQELLPVLRQP